MDLFYINNIKNGSWIAQLKQRDRLCLLFQWILFKKRRYKNINEIILVFYEADFQNLKIR